MTKIQHGKYDATRGLPDNTGVPQGSGSVVRWHGLIREALGAEAGQALIEESRTHGTGSQRWLLAQLSDAGHAELVESYKQLRRDDAAALRIRDHERIVRHCKIQLLDIEVDGVRRIVLERQLAKAQKYLKKHAK